MTSAEFGTRPFPPVTEAADGWERLLADVTGRPDFATPLVAALAQPATLEMYRRLDALLEEPIET